MSDTIIHVLLAKGDANSFSIEVCHSALFGLYHASLIVIGQSRTSDVIEGWLSSKDVDNVSNYDTQ